jgi:hypothetical protein
VTTQPNLLSVPPDKTLKGPGGVRTWTGHYAAEIACAMMGWEFLTVDGRQEFCPDARTRKGRDIEIKSVALSGCGKSKSVIYKWRMEKEQLHSPDLLYAFVGRRVPLSKSLLEACTIKHILDAMAVVSLEIVLVPATVVHAAALAGPLYKIKRESKGKKEGYTRKGYIDGYHNVEVGPWFASAGTRRLVWAEVHGRKYSAFWHEVEW